MFESETKKMEQMIEKIEQHYEAGNDLDPNAPPVNWVEIALVNIIKSLIQRITRLETLLEEHEAGGYRNMR